MEYREYDEYRSPKLITNDTIINAIIRFVIFNPYITSIFVTLLSVFFICWNVLPLIHTTCDCGANGKVEDNSDMMRTLACIGIIGAHVILIALIANVTVFGKRLFDKSNRSEINRNDHSTSFYKECIYVQEEDLKNSSKKD